MAEKKSGGSCQLGTVGGQAVIEGVMMKSPEKCAVAVRREDGSVSLTDIGFKSSREKVKLFNLPFVRGIVNFIEMMALSYKTLSISAEAFGLEEADESKFEKWMQKHFGKGIIDIVMGVAMVLGLGLGFGLFFFAPIFITKLLDSVTGDRLGWFKNLVEGIIKIVIFVAYLLLVSLMKDIRRTFEYHGAEHKTIFCYEAGGELTPENIKKYSRFHPRCGTSFMFVMLIISILIFSLPIVTWDNMFLRMATKLALLPLIVGAGYEFIRFAGKHDNAVTRFLSAPGLWMQRITTREPDDSQIEIAVAALKRSLPSVFPGFTIEEPPAISETSGNNASGNNAGGEAGGASSPRVSPVNTAFTGE